MAEIDLWEDDALPQAPAAAEPKQAPRPVEPVHEQPALLASALSVPEEATIALAILGDRIHLTSKRDLAVTLPVDFPSLTVLETRVEGSTVTYLMPLGAVNSYVLRYILKRFRVAVSPENGKILASYADRIALPVATMDGNGKHVEVHAPNIKVYMDILKKVGSYRTQSGHRLAIGRVLDLEHLIEQSESVLPKIVVKPDVLNLTRAAIPNFDGTLEALKYIPTSVLNVVSANAQSGKSLKASKATMEEKFAKFGVATLHDLLFTLPKRFIDKSNPQPLENLIEGEAVTITGRIASVENLPNNMGIAFIIENGRGSKIRANFWRQAWLKAKFAIGEEVLLTGRASWYKREVQLGGSSIEHADQAAVLPIVPVYRQSESSGITTSFIMAAVRELLSRAGNIALPQYLSASGRMAYTEALTELHFPTSLELFKAACNDLAYYELVYMQLVIQEERSRIQVKKGIVQAGGKSNLQTTAARALPFSLTNSQKVAVRRMNELLADGSPSQVLLNADVGAGKTLVAQLSCLRAVDSGHQAIILAPTEILAEQLYSTFAKIQKSLEDAGMKFKVALLRGGMKVAEKKPILAEVASGEIDVLVGTTGVIGDKVKYRSLGLIVVDEQQKFGAEQRSKMLASREDGLVPDLLSQSATPIPRSTAQIFYGDMESIELTEKPPGRLPIITEWIEEEPVEFSTQVANRVWSDIREEAAHGNQTFVITPMVSDSDKVDAASVERTFKNLSQGTLSGLRVGFVHGQMKKDVQQETMKAFRNREYDVIVASTVVEVGVDIPDATRVVILSADRMGASSLHQIRGRVGRNDKQSKCYLVALAKTDSGEIRLQSLVDSENGFDIALADLSVRGEGKIFGAEQSGSSEMIFASLARHKEWIEPARQEAATILTSPHRDIALADAHLKFDSLERLF